MDLFLSNALLFVGIAVGLVIAFPMLVAMHLFHSRAGAGKDREIAAQAARIAELEPLVHVDPLTGVGNRRMFDDMLAAKVAHAMRSGESLTVLVMDANGFKAVNDTYGHPVGDSLLRRIAESLDKEVRASDTVCRFGGDEFAVIMVGCGVEHGIAAIRRITERLAANSLTHRSGAIAISISIGGACMTVADGIVSVAGKDVGPNDQLDVMTQVPQTLYREADRRLYVAKTRKTAERFPVEFS